MTPAERHKVARDIARIPGIIKDQLALEGFQFPPPTISNVPYLIPPEPDGLKCRKCPYIAKQEKKIHKHCRSCQGWKNPRSRGRPKKGGIDLALERPWIEHVPCQRFFPSRAASGWFEVGRKLAGCKGKPAGTIVDGQCGGSAAVAPETRAHLQEVLEREQKYLDAEKQPRVYSKALGDDSFAGTSLWLERTQWPVTYKGVRRDILQAMTRLPNSIGIDPNIDTHFVLGQGPHEGDAGIVSLRGDEQKISCALGAVDLMLDRCELTVQHTSRLLRCWLVSSKPGNYQPKPFALMTQENTRKKYRILWKRFIAFIFRATLMPVTLRERELKIYLSPEISRQLDRLWAHEAWDFIDVTRRKWPQMSKIGNERSLLDASVDAKDEPVSSMYEEMAGWDSNYSMSDDDASSMTEDSEDGFEEFQEEESDETFEEATTNPASEHTRVESRQWKEANFQANDRAAASALDEFLEFLFQLSVTLSTERFLDGQAGSTLLIYFSGIMRRNSSDM